MSVVAIVGRQNVGKSALFNRLIGRRQALVSDMPGLTRDRHYAHTDWCGVEFSLIDTGGLSFDESDAVESKVHDQSLVAMEEADVVICLFDGREGVQTLDREIVRIFRKSGKSIVYAVNKIDTEGNEALATEFSELGVDVVPISAEHGRNIDILLDKVINLLPPHEAVERPEGMRIALVGRPNVGKSTIINRLAQEERVVAHELPGTTRDSIDVDVEFGGRHFVFVDTAGVKKRARTLHKIDKFSTIKSLRSIEDAEVVFIVVDGKEGLSRQDLSLAAYAFNSYKTTAILVNKWDLVTEREKAYIEELRFNLKELRDLPVLCISGKTGHNCEEMFDIAIQLDEAMRRRVSTAELNRFLKYLVGSHPAPDYGGKQVKLYYIAQAEVEPPVFVVFTNQPKGIGSTYKKYLTKGLRDILGKPMVPMVVKFKSK